MSYLTTFWLLKRYRAANLSAFFFLTPVFGVIAGVTLLGEPLSAGFVAGAALVAAGIYVVNS
jgi:drug/metabolite transporter (DMT)-like permease